MAKWRSRGTTVEVTVCWGGKVLHHQRLARGSWRFALGGHNSDFAVAEEILGCERLELLTTEPDGTPRLLLPDAVDDDSAIWTDEDLRTVAEVRAQPGGSVALRPGMNATLLLGAISIDLECSRERLPRTPRFALKGRYWGIQAAVAAAAVLTVLAGDFIGPLRSDTAREDERVEVARRYLLRVEQRREAEQNATMAAEANLGDLASRAKGEEGSMGKTGQRYAVGGHARATHGTGNAWAAAARDANEFGMIGLLSAAGAGAGAAPSLPSYSSPSVIAESGYVDFGVNPAVDPAEDPLSTFAIDVDTGSYSAARRSLRFGRLPQAPAVRAEEFINYFDYGYPGPESQPGNRPLLAHLAAAPSPFAADRHLVRVALQAKRIASKQRKAAHLVYLVDTSGSMRSVDKLGLVKQSLKLLTDNLRDGDTVALCTYAGSVREVLAPTAIRHKFRIFDAIDELGASGSTAMGGGLKMAYELAARTRVRGHVNRVIVLSDGDANVGPTDHETILKTIRHHKDAGITLSTVGFGMGNYRDDLMEQLADAGDGNYSYIDSDRQAKRVFVEQLGSLIEVVARDVKVQVAFDPSVVKSYRLIGYENRDVADADFRNDQVDGGEVGSGHSVTALYDVELKPFQFASSSPWLTVNVRYKAADNSGEVGEDAYVLTGQDIASSFAEAPAGFRLASAVAGFAEVLRESPHAVHWDLQAMTGIAAAANRGTDAAELVDLMDQAIALL